MREREKGREREREKERKREREITSKIGGVEEEEREGWRTLGRRCPSRLSPRAARI